MSTYRVEPVSTFVEVPYPLLGEWTSGGYTWQELVAANGLPPAVRARLTPTNVKYCERVVCVWPSFETYSQTTGEKRCRVGRAWIGPGRDGPVTLLTYALSTPMAVGQRRRWRW
jgi:hypothetical protein